jgi:hypothetical protein
MQTLRRLDLAFFFWGAALETGFFFFGCALETGFFFLGSALAIEFLLLRRFLHAGIFYFAYHSFRFPFPANRKSVCPSTSSACRITLRPAFVQSATAVLIVEKRRNPCGC